jgi:RNA polymerase sigma-70 factor (ECF subfamily)
MLEAALPGDSAIAALTRRMATGDEAAFRDFHAEYFSRLFRYLIVCCRGDEEAARDALQETMVRVVRHVRCFQDEKAFWDWLTVLARSAAVDGGRKRSRYGNLLTRFARTTVPTPVPPMNGAIHEALERGLEELPPDDRALLFRKYEEGAGVRQIALDSGTSESAVESRLVRIRRQLRELIFLQLKS